MSPDDPFWAPGRTVPPPQPRPGELVWTLDKGGYRYRCELRDDARVGAGVEAQIWSDTNLLIGRRFDTRALAVQWAEEERKALEGPHEA